MHRTEPSLCPQEGGPQGVLCGKLLESQLCGLCCPLLVMTYIHTISPRPAGEGWLFRSHWGDSLGCSKRGSHHYISETFFFFFKIYLFYVYEYTVAVFRHQKRVSDSNTDGCELPCGCWELNSRPLKEQLVLLTAEPSLCSYS